MKSTLLTIFAALVSSLWTNTARAQVLSPASLAPLEVVPQIIPVVPTLAPPLDLANQTNLMGVANRRVPSQNVKDLVKDFRTARQEFLESQQELLRQLKLATEEQRAIIREQLKENLNDFRELQKTQLQDLREQTKDIINNVPITDVINSGTRDLLGR